MTVCRFLKLVQAESLSTGYLTDSNCNMKSLVEIATNLLGQLACPRGLQIDILRQSRLRDVRIDCLRPEYDCVIASLQELQHGIVHRRER